MTAFFASLAFVFLAEMGDKTQLLSMALATRFPWKTVLLGVLAATAANHYLAVCVGGYCTIFLPLPYIQTAAAASFILFGFWTLRGDRLSGEDRRYSYGPFWTTAIAFFCAEMGDKTQLATVALAAEYQSTLPVWLGTTLAMILADGLGIGVGMVLGRKMPERLIKWISASIFILFGIFGVYKYFPRELGLPILLPLGVGLLGISLWLLASGRIGKAGPGPQTE